MDEWIDGWKEDGRIVRTFKSYERSLDSVG